MALMVSGTDASDLAGQPSDRRKLIVVVHADVVGYSRLIGLDDIGTLDRMRRLRREVIDPAIDTYGGRIVNTGGAALLMAFDSVDGAVRCCNDCCDARVANAGAAACIDPVTPAKQIICSTCYIERAPISSNRCSPDGKLWEPAEDKPAGFV
jgi:class 3 adenylate cyclase